MTSSTPPEVKAVVTLARSNTFVNVLKWSAIVVVWPALVGGASWAAAKLDTKQDIVALREDIAALTRQQSELTKRIDESLPAMNIQLNAVYRDLTVVGGAALSYEQKPEAKLAWGEELARSFDGKFVARGAAGAFDSVIHSVAPPKR